MDVRNISKAKQSAVAKAAYVSGSKLYSERDEEFKQFRKREERPISFILAPAHAPEWVYDREQLWNESEKVEKPINARVQREVLVALPIELTKEQNVNLVKEYVEENFVFDGMVADVNIHFDKKENPHAHILLTVRPFNNDGTWWEKKSKKVALTDENGNFILNDEGKKKHRAIDLTGWNDKEKLLQWREKLAEKINEKYKEYGIDEQVTHLSNEAAGISKSPKQRLTRGAYYIEQREKERALENDEEYVPVTKYGKLNFEIEKNNLEIEELNFEIEQLEKEKLRYQSKDNNVIELKDYILQRQNEFDGQLTVEQATAKSFVLGRSKSEIFDYAAIHKAKNSVDGWGRTIAKKVRELNTEKAFLEKIAEVHVTKPKELINYGFNQEQFADLFNQYSSDFKNKEMQLSKEFEKYQVANKTIKLAKDLHYAHLKRLFDTVYPEHKEISRFKTDENMKIMDKYLNQLLKENILQPVVEFEAYGELSNKEEHVFRAKTINAMDGYNRYIAQYFGLDKRIHLLEQQIEKVSENVSYQEKLELHVMKEEFQHVKKQLEKAKTGLYNSLIELYGEEQKDVVIKVPDKVKAHILKDFIENRQVRDLSEHLRNEKSKMDKHLPNDFNQQQSKSNNTGDLLSQLLAQSMMLQDKNKYDRSYLQKRKKKDYSKGYITTKEMER